MKDSDKTIEYYDYFSNNEIPWLMRGQELLCSSDLLKKHGVIKDGVVINGVVQMLRGMGIECLLKAAILCSGKKIAEKGKIIREDGQGTHDLLKLTQLLKIKLTKGEEEVLKILSSYIEIGRYPLFSNWKKAENAHIPSSFRKIPRGVESLVWVYTENEDSFNTLLEKINEVIAK